MEFEVPKRHILEPNIIINMVQQSGKRDAMVGKRQGHMIEKWCYNKFWMKVFFGEEKTKTSEQSNLIFFLPKLPLLDIY